MSFRLHPAPFATVLLLVISGCGGSGKGPSSSPYTRAATVPPRTATAPARTTAHTTAAPRTTSNPAQMPGETQPAGAGDEQGIRVPATFTFHGASATPPQISVPAFLAIELTIVSGDGRAHAVTLMAGGHRYALAAPPHGRAQVRIPGQRAGTYRLMQPGGSVAGTLLIGGEPGP